MNESMVTSAHWILAPCRVKVCMLTLNRLIVAQYDAASCRCCCLQNKSIIINEIHLHSFNVKRKGQGIIERFFELLKMYVPERAPCCPTGAVKHLST